MGREGEGRRRERKKEEGRDREDGEKGGIWRREEGRQEERVGNRGGRREGEAGGKERGGERLIWSNARRRTGRDA